MKNNRKNDTYSTTAWNTETKGTWSVEEVQELEPVNDDREVAPAGYLRYRAVYEFYARNKDEITFQPGDIVMVSFIMSPTDNWSLKVNYRFRWNKTVRRDGLLARLMDTQAGFLRRTSRRLMKESFKSTHQLQIRLLSQLH